MIGILIKATIIKNDTKYNFIFKILVFILFINLSFMNRMLQLNKLEPLIQK